MAALPRGVVRGVNLRSRLMKILVLPSWYPSEESPVEGVFIEDQVRVLSREHDVAVLVPRVAPFRGWWSPGDRLATTIRDEAGTPVVRAFSRSRVPKSRKASMHAQLRAADEGYRRVVREWGRPDVIWAHVVLPAGWVAIRVARRYDIPVILTEHSSPFSMHLGSRWQRKKVRRTLAGCHAVIAIGPDLARQMRGSGHLGTVEVVGEVVDVPEPSGIPSLLPPPSPGRLRLATVGMLREQKGIRYLIEALAQLVSGGLDLELAIAGDGPLRTDLERVAAEQGVAERCRFLGFLSRPEVYGLLVASDLLVVPSLHETFCVAAAEGLACGKPVVTTRCGGPDEYVTERVARWCRQVMLVHLQRESTT